MAEIKIDETVYTLYEGITIVGRGDDADITIDSQKLSRTHARFTLDGENVYIEDLGSKNGTYVNDAKIEAKQEISPSDRIQLGNLPCLLVGSKSETESKPSPVVKPKTVRTSPVSAAEPVDIYLKRNLLISGIIAGICVIIILTAMVNQGKQSDTSLHLISEAETALSIVKVTGDNELNKEWVEKLKTLKEKLSTISEEHSSFVTSRDLITAINMVSGEIKAAVKTEDPEKEAMEAYEKAINGLKSGFSAEEVLARLKTVVTLYPDTKGAGFAQEKIFEIEKAQRNSE